MSDETNSETTVDEFEADEAVTRENPGGIGPNMNLVVTEDGFLRVYLSEQVTSCAFAMNAVAARALAEELLRAADVADDARSEFETLVNDAIAEAEAEDSQEDAQLELMN